MGILVIRKSIYKTPSKSITIFQKLAKAGAATKALLDEFNITTSSPSQQPVPSNTAGEEGAADANAGVCCTSPIANLSRSKTELGF